VDQTTARVIEAVPSEDGRSVTLRLDRIVEDHIHEFTLAGVRSRDGQRLVHAKAYYTVNEIPKE
jgi:limonene-1,2-epoxide hydrolase